jgi:mRNA interferase MazF
VEAPAKGAVVLVRFPFSDLSATKLRPAVVLADAGRRDRILARSQAGRTAMHSLSC